MSAIPDTSGRFAAIMRISLLHAKAVRRNFINTVPAASKRIGQDRMAAGDGHGKTQPTQTGSLAWQPQIPSGFRDPAVCVHP
jgi:hypothetical protein